MCELDALVGERLLGGVEYSDEGIVFQLDGIVYCAVEDPDDGYRSSMSELCIVDHISNVFESVRVVGRMNEDVLELTDVHTGKLVLEVGTDYSDSYYPCFVASFHPENMVINQ